MTVPPATTASPDASSDPSTNPGPFVILVIEDEPAPLQVIEASLAARQYQVRTATTGARALELVAADEPDVIILDLGLPDVDGLHLSRHLRLWTGCPIIVVTADGNEERMITALDEGADDYVIKPFSMPELLARVRVAIRHRRLLADVADEPIIVVGALSIDVEAHTVTVAGRPVELPPKQFELVTLLARNSGRMLTHRKLVQRLWGAEADESVSNSLRIHVSKLRRKLGEGDGVPRIVSERHIGYRMVESD